MSSSGEVATVARQVLFAQPQSRSTHGLNLEEDGAAGYRNGDRQQVGTDPGSLTSTQSPALAAVAQTSSSADHPAECFNGWPMNAARRYVMLTDGGAIA